MSQRKRFQKIPPKPASRSTKNWPLGWRRRRGCGIYRVSTIREDVLHEPHPLGCHANRLMMGLPLRVVHYRTTDSSHPRDVGQFHQPFPWSARWMHFVTRSSNPRASISAS